MRTIGTFFFDLIITWKRLLTVRMEIHQNDQFKKRKK